MDVLGIGVLMADVVEVRSVVWQGEFAGCFLVFVCAPLNWFGVDEVLYLIYVALLDAL